MKHLKYLLLFLFITACNTRPMLTQLDFEKIEEGNSISTVLDKHGRPDKVRFNGDATEEYVYIDRVQVSPRITEFIYYIFKVEEGVVVDKEMERSEPPPVVRILGTSR